MNTETLDIRKLMNDLVQEMERVCSASGVLAEPDEDSGVWFFNLTYEKGSYTGAVSIESNVEDLGFPTVGINLSLFTADALTKEDLLELMFASSNFWRASLVAYPVSSSSWELFLQYRVSARVFKPEEFVGCVDHLVTQARLFIPGWDASGSTELH